MVSRRVLPSRGHHCIVRCAVQCNTLLADSQGRHTLSEGLQGLLLHLQVCVLLKKDCLLAGCCLPGADRGQRWTVKPAQ